MRKADLVKRLRTLQGVAYGAYASATHYADREKERDRYPIMVGSLHSATGHLAKQLDELATDIERRGVRGRMKKHDLVARLRTLQGIAYGAYASAGHIADRDVERPGGNEQHRYPQMVGALYHYTEHLARQLDKLATDIEGSHRRAKLGKLRASVLACTLLLGIAGSARADAIYDIHPNMGAVIENNHTPCGADARAWLVTFVATLQVLVLGEREHIRLIYNDATHTPDYELEGDPLIGFWRGGKKTVFVSLQGDAVHPRLDIAFILRDADGTCYEKWEGLGLRR